VVSSQEPTIGKTIVSEVSMAMYNRSFNVSICGDIRYEAPIVGVGGGYAGVVVGISIGLSNSISVSVSVSVSFSVSFALLAAKVEERRHIVMNNGGNMMGMVDNGGVVEDWVGNYFV